MKLLFVGHNPYINWLVRDLHKEGFLDKISIDVIEVKSVRKKPKSFNKKIRSAWRKLRKLNYTKLQLTFFLRKGFDTDALEKYFNLKCERLDHPNVKYQPYNRFFNNQWTSVFDRMIVATYGGLIAREQFESPRLGTWNIHPSVLPELKGGYPTLVQALNPKCVTGTTIHEMTTRIDEGKIVFQKNTGYSEGKTNLQLFRRSASTAAQLLANWQRNLYKANVKALAVLEPTTCKEFHKTVWNLRDYDSNTEVDSLVRAYNTPHMYPFIYLIQGREFIQLLNIQRMDSQSVNYGIKVANIRSVESATLTFYNKQYRLKTWMVNGKLYNTT